MDLDEELEVLEDGVETEGIAAEDESDLEIEDEFEDIALGADAEEENLEDVYKDFENDEADIDGAPAPNIGFEVVDLEDLEEEEEEEQDSDQPTRRSAKRSDSNKKTGKKRKLARNAVFDEFAEEDDSEEEETSGEEGYINEEVSGL